MKKDEYAIWGGRFQIIHKGHEYILKYILNNYKNICIGIVNPHPKTPPCSPKKFEKFALNKNPLTYFQRAYLWDLLLKDYDIDAVIVPHWHPRKSLKLESTFLPPKRLREWIIPNLDNEEYKMEDIQNADETVIFENFNEPDNYKAINASNIRLQFNNYKHYIPNKIMSKTEEFLNGKNLNMKHEKFIIVPIIGDEIHHTLLCCGIQRAFNMNKKLIFAPVVNVEDKLEWWKYKSTDDCILTFYRRYEIINKLVKSIGYYDFMILPIIVKNNSCEFLNAFLPDIRDREWFFIEGINEDLVFENIYSNESTITLPTQQFSDNILQQLSELKDKLFEKLDYDTIKKLKNKSKERDLKQIIELILNSNNEDEIQKNVENANVLLNGISKAIYEKIIIDLVKKNIDSEEKKNSLLQKFIDIVPNLIINLLIEAIKNIWRN